MKDLRTFIINEKIQPGGNSYKEYTWKEVLDYFGAPEELEDTDDLKEWYEKENEVSFDYLIEQWRDENGEIVEKKEHIMKIYTANRETGSFIEEAESIDMAKAMIRFYEDEDKKNDVFESNFYDVVNQNHESLLQENLA